MHVVLATFGTDGDVYPYLGLGRHVVAHGHSVTLASSPHYAEAARNYGFAFQEIIGREEIDRVLWNPDFWHPWKAGPLAAKWGLKFLSEQYASLAKLVTSEPTVLIANPGMLAARLVHEKIGVPFISVVLQPWLLPSVHRPAAIPGLLPVRAPRWLWRVQIELLHRFSDHLLGPELNRLRRSLDLPPIRKILQWWFSPQCVLGFFPEWFGPRQPDWPSTVQLSSFPMFDGSDDARLSAEIEQFLGAGELPIAITFGTGIRHAKGLYAAALQACRERGRRAIVITKYPEQVPPIVNGTVIATKYAPFSSLFPKCAAVIHHGGIGTTAKALRAKIPQVIIPVCFDQLDNGLRVQELGRGSWVRLKAATARRIASELQSVLTLAPLNSLPADKEKAYEFAVNAIEAL